MNKIYIIAPIIGAALGLLIYLTSLSAHDYEGEWIKAATDLKDGKITLLAYCDIAELGAPDNIKKDCIKYKNTLGVR
jgi:hypothetical protein